MHRRALTVPRRRNWGFDLLGRKSLLSCIYAPCTFANVLLASITSRHAYTFDRKRLAKQERKRKKKKKEKRVRESSASLEEWNGKSREKGRIGETRNDARVSRSLGLKLLWSGGLEVSFVWRISWLSSRTAGGIHRQFHTGSTAGTKEGRFDPEVTGVRSSEARAVHRHFRRSWTSLAVHRALRFPLPSFILLPSLVPLPTPISLSLSLSLSVVSLSPLFFRNKPRFASPRPGD